MAVRRSLALVLALGCALGPAAAAAPAITEPVDLAAPASGIATGSDGALWVSLPSANKLARVTTASAVGYVTVPRAPAAVAAGADGALWTVQQASKGRGVARVTTDGVVTNFTGLTGLPTGIAAGPDGNLWVVEQDATFLSASPSAAVARVTPAGTVTEFRAGPDDPFAIAPGPDGALWFTTEASFGRATTAGAVTHYHPPLLSEHRPAGITAGPGGLWVAMDDAVARIAGTAVEGFGGGDDDADRNGAAFSEATAIADGPDGAVWFTAKDSIGRVTPSGEITLYGGSRVSGDAGAGIAAGPDGAMWFTQKEAKLGRITVPPLADGLRLVSADAATAQIAAEVRANALPATARLTVYDDLDNTIGSAEASVPAGTGKTPVSFLVSGLRSGTRYTATLTASSAAGPSLPVAPLAFTALAPPVVATPTPTPTAIASPTPAVTPAVTPEPTPAPAVEPAPVLTETVVLAAARGDVRVRIPGRLGFAPVEEAGTVPLGALVDTSRGEVELRSELADGTVQTGFFRGGLFRVHQRAGGATRVVLAGRLDCGRRRGSEPVAGVSRRGKRKRKVWGRDDGGSFETHGRDSVATVRGTEWLTQDTCAGTLTRVTEGAVSVRPKRGGRAKLVRAGQRLLVPHRG